MVWLGHFVLFVVMQLIISLLAAFCSDLPNIEFLLQWTAITECWIKIAPCLGVEVVNVIYCLSLSVNLQIEESKQSALLISWLFEARCFFVHFWLTNSVLIMVRAIIFNWHKSKMIFLVARNRTIHYYHPMHEKITIFHKICGFLCNFENVGFTYQALLQLHCTVAWKTSLFLHIILKQNFHLNNSDKNITLLKCNVHVNVHVYGIMSSK